MLHAEVGMGVYSYSMPVKMPSSSGLACLDVHMTRYIIELRSDVGIDVPKHK